MNLKNSIGSKINYGTIVKEKRAIKYYKKCYKRQDIEVMKSNPLGMGN